MAANARAAAGRSHEQDLAGVARGGSLNLVGHGLSQVLRFAMTLVLARLLDVANVGLYSQAFAFLSVLALMSLSGFQSALIRFVAVHRADNHPALLRGTVQLGLALPTGSAVVLGCALFALSPWLADSVFHDPRLLSPFRFVAVSLPATVFTDAALAATRGFKSMRAYALISLVFEPTSRFFLTWLLVAVGFGLTGAMVALVVTNFAAAALAARALWRLMGHSGISARYDWRGLFAFSSASWAATVASTGLLWADTMLLGILGTASDVGLYQVATRLTLFAMIFMHAINASFSPRIADLYRSGRRDDLSYLYKVVTSLIVRLSVPAFMLLLVFPSELLAIFGSVYEVGAPVTMLLAIGTLADVLSGPCGHMLMMSGRPYLAMANNIGALALNIGLNVWLIPRYGIIGAGVAWAASLIFINLARVFQVYATMRMVPFDPRALKGVVAAAAALPGALLVQSSLGGFGALIWGAAAIVVVYAGTIFLLGVEKEDRLVWASLRRQIGRADDSSVKADSIGRS
jgi:O-antigen/teichoic acid export membrane protein